MPTSGKVHETKFSIIVPVFNTGIYLEDCLKSVLAQKFQSVEIICVDDGSTDESRAILKRYAEMDARIRVLVYDENHGPSFARNRGLEQATGTYVYLLDSDDMMPPFTLQKIYTVAEKDDLDGVLYDIQTLFEGDTDREKFQIHRVYQPENAEICSGKEWYIKKRKKGHLILATCTGCWRRAFLEKYQIRYREGVLHEDVPVAFRALLLAQRVRVLPMYGYTYRRRPNSITTRDTSMKNVEGQLAVAADETQFLLEHARELGETCIRAGITDIRGTLRNQRKFLIESCGALLETTHFADPMLQVLYEQTLQTNFHYLKGYLIERVRKRLDSFDDIIIYGAGKIGCEVLRLLEEYGIRNYQLAVTEKGDTMKGLMGMASELRTLQSLRETALVVVSAGQKARPQMLAEAQRLGFRNVVAYDEIM